MPAVQRRTARVVAVVLLVLCAGWLAEQWRDESRLAGAQEALAEGRAQAALEDATSVSGAAIDARAAATAARAALGLGDLETAAGHLERAIRESPRAWELRHDHAVVLRRLGRTEEATAEMSRALALNPRLVLPRGFSGPDAP